MTDDRKRNTGGEVDIAAMLAVMLDDRAYEQGGNKLLTDSAHFLRTQSRALAESRAEVEALRASMGGDADNHVAIERDRHKARAERLAGLLKVVSAVGVVQLFDTHRDDVMAAFTLDQLKEISRVTEHKRPAQVEHIYREGWDAALQEHEA